jgi:hypothetical protein
MGKQVGGKPVLDKNLSQSVLDVVRRADRVEGKSRRETIDMIMEVKPELSFNKHPTILTERLKYHKDEIKSKPVKARRQHPREP